MATFAIGDIQGCYSPFRRLLDRCGFDPTRDRLVLVGDLVNRGSHSLDVLRFISQLDNRVLGVLGNHDLYLLLRAEGVIRGHRHDTLDEVLSAHDARALLGAIRQWPLCRRVAVEDKSFLVVHAGLCPAWDIELALTLSNEVTLLFNSRHRHSLMSNLWGDQPSIWSSDLQGWDRYRLIINAMTRMRFLSTHPTQFSAMVLGDEQTKGTLAQLPSDCLPWFDFPGRRSQDTTIVCGHWSALGLLLRDDLIALDTGCVWGGPLTAIRLEDRRLFQEPS
jgi:bis(5'-nucleosyl)-tetraphosphatase (symmetrical)